jgi:hypothetical protein
MPMISVAKYREIFERDVFSMEDTMAISGRYRSPGFYYSQIKINQCSIRDCILASFYHLLLQSKYGNALAVEDRNCSVYITTNHKTCFNEN